jgi:cephalosporin hydroxylase
MELIAAGRTVAQVLEELRAYRRVVWHDWYCQYADGTIVHNDFRWYRTTDDVWNYFVGYPNSHDCDATVTDQFGRRLGKFCTRQAAAFARAHGGIVYVGRE